MNDPELYTLLRRLVEAVERLRRRHRRDALRSAKPTPSSGMPMPVGWKPCQPVNRVAIELLKGIERQAEILLDNTRRFAAGLPANNALLWGARGTGKSSLVKAVHERVNREAKRAPGAGRGASGGHREPAASARPLRGQRRAAAWCFATISRSTAATPPTSR